MLDTGATRSGVTAEVAERLGVRLDESPPVLLRGVNGIVIVPTIRVDSITVGDLTLGLATLPVVIDAMGGAEGVLATGEFKDQRIVIDFKHDRIEIRHSRGERARPGFTVIPLDRVKSGLLMFHALIGGSRVQAIIDTGGQRTIGNHAMREALEHRHARGRSVQIFDVTAESQTGEAFRSPPIELGSIDVSGVDITYGEMTIFRHWQLTKEPALLVGMDVLGLLDTFIIDYRLHELQLRVRTD